MKDFIEILISCKNQARTPHRNTIIYNLNSHGCDILIEL